MADQPLPTGDRKSTTLGGAAKLKFVPKIPTARKAVAPIAEEVASQVPEKPAQSNFAPKIHLVDSAASGIFASGPGDSHKKGSPTVFKPSLTKGFGVGKAQDAYLGGAELNLATASIEFVNSALPLLLSLDPAEKISFGSSLFLLQVPEFPIDEHAMNNGCIGEIVVRQSGKVQLCLGHDPNKIYYDISLGINSNNLQHVVLIDPASLTMSDIGAVSSRLIAVQSEI